MAAAPLSAARLEAEAAFAAPQLRLTPAIQAQVTVRRTRLLVVPEKEVAGDAPAAEPAAKSPRVFRVEAAHSAESALAGPALQPPVTKRRRRAAVGKAPGEVFHVVRAQPAVPALAFLVAELASVAPVLDLIRRAQSLWFIDDRLAKDWQRLSKRADVLLAQLRGHRR